MSQGNDMSAEMHELMALLREDQLTDDGAQRLAELVSDDPVARKIYIEHITSYASLRWYLSGSEGNPEIELSTVSSGSVFALLEESAAASQREAEERARTGGLAAAELPAVHPGSRSKSIFVRWQKACAAIAAIAATIALTVVWMLPTPVIVASIGDSVDAQWGDPSRSTASGTRLSTGENLYLTHGVVELTFEGGAKTIVEAPATLELLSPDSARLVQGQLVAQVPPRATGFTIETPRAKVVDLGTEFGIRVHPDGELEVHVFEGMVDLAITTERCQNLSFA